MATQNSLRNPRRTAATASALMIGVALVTLMSIFGSSAKASIDDQIAKDVTADYVVSNAIGQPFSAEIATKVAAVPGVAETARTRWSPVSMSGEPEWAQGIDPVAVRAMTAVKNEQRRLRPGRSRRRVDQCRHGQGPWAEGRRQHPAGQPGAKCSRRASSASTRRAPWSAAAWSPTCVTRVAGAARPGLDDLHQAGDLGHGVDRAGRPENALADLPMVTVKDQKAFADEQRKPIDTMLTIIYAPSAWPSSSRSSASSTPWRCRSSNAPARSGCCEPSASAVDSCARCSV